MILTYTLAEVSNGHTTIELKKNKNLLLYNLGKEKINELIFGMKEN